MGNWFWKFVLVLGAVALSIYYKLGVGGDRREEIKELLDEVKNKLHPKDKNIP